MSLLSNPFIIYHFYPAFRTNIPLVLTFASRTSSHIINPSLLPLKQIKR